MLRKMTADLVTIGSHKLKSVQNGEVVEMKSFWQNQDAAIFFFRRWGCMFCRLWAKEIGEIAPILKKHNIRLIGVGVEETGSKEFSEGKFFDGELYYVEDLSTYQALGYKRFNMFTILASLFWKQSRDAIFKGRSMGVQGDMKGDKVQTGGALFVGSGGTLKGEFQQSGPADHMPNLEILKVFGLESEYKPEKSEDQTSDQPAPVSNN